MLQLTKDRKKLFKDYLKFKILGIIIFYCCHVNNETNTLDKTIGKKINDTQRNEYNLEIDNKLDRNLKIRKINSGIKDFNYVSKYWFEGFDISSFNPSHNNSLVKAIIIPHAGLKFTGEEISNILSNVNWKNFDKVIILSTNHKNNQNFQLDRQVKILNSPLNTNQKIPTFFYDDPNISTDNKKMSQEHSWQIILPFLTLINKKYGNLSICPIVIGNNNIDISKLQKYIENNPNTLIIANTDLLHCGTNYGQECPKNIQKRNIKTTTNIKNAIINGEKLENTREDLSTLCGYSAINTFVKLCSKLNYNRIVELSYDSSSYKNNDFQNSVGYATMAFTQPLEKYKKKIAGKSQSNVNITEKELKHIAKNAIRESRQLQAKSPVTFNKFLKKFNGVFVTLYDSNNHLRGCIGNFNLNEDIIGEIKRVAVESSLDNRFNKIKSEEIDDLNIEITILGPQMEIVESDLDEVIANHQYGITAYFKNTRATFIASAIKEHNMTSKNILEKLKEKAGVNERPMKLKKYRCYNINEWLNS